VPAVERPILIASSSFDEHSHRPVRERLEKRGHRTVLYLTDRVLAGDAHFSLSVSPEGVLQMAYDDKSMAPDDVAAAWYWKVGGFRIANAEHNVAKQLSLVNEITQWNSAIFGLFPDDVWLNAPRRIAQAEPKLRQLLVARSLGFEIPQTLVTSRWQDVEQELLAKSETIVVKMLRGVLADGNELKAMYTTPLDHHSLAGLQDATVPFPGLYQPFVPKAREWRVTVVGDAVFGAAIYTEAEGSHDWRRHQGGPLVRFRREALPDDVADRCRAYVKTMSLAYGAFDLIERPDGAIVFLECNPGGQHNWLEVELGLPIADAIAAELIRIARR
jgi:hypothetical protein